MEIIEIRMDHFGKFNGQSMEFHPGINVIYGDNETGKSTMRSFIRGMFLESTGCADARRSRMNTVCASRGRTAVIFPAC